MTKKSGLIIGAIVFIGVCIYLLGFSKNELDKKKYVFSQKEVLTKSIINKKSITKNDQVFYEKTREIHLNGKIYSEFKQKINGISIEPYGAVYTTRLANGKVIKNETSAIKKYTLSAPINPSSRNDNQYVYWVTEFSDVSNLVLAKVIYENGWKKVISLADNKVLFRKKIELQ